MAEVLHKFAATTWSDDFVSALLLQVVRHRTQKKFTMTKRARDANSQAEKLGSSNVVQQKFG